MVLDSAVLFVAAVFIGLFASLLGIGGGAFMVPLLVLGGFVDEMKFAVGTSISAVAFTSLASSIGYLRESQVNVRLGAALAPTTVIGGYYGAVASDVLPEDVLSIAFGVFLLYPGAKMVLVKEVDESKGYEKRGWMFYFAILVFGAVVGFSSGVFGIGGGSLMVPALTLVLGMNIVRAVATSLFAMFPSAVVASYKQYGQGNLIPEYALPLIVGISVGATIGPYISDRVPDDILKRGFGIVLLVTAVRMVLRGV